DDRVAISLEPLEQSAEEALEEEVERCPQLLPFGPPVLPADQLLGQIAVFEHAVEIDRGGDENQRRGELRIALGADDVIEHAELRLLERAVAGEAPLDEDALRHAVAGDGADERGEDGVIERLAIAPP